MPVLAKWLISGFSWAVGSGLGQFMASLGLAFVVYEFAVESFLAQMAQHWAGLPAFAAQMLGWFKVDKAMTVILSAYAVSASAGLISGMRRKAVFRP